MLATKTVAKDIAALENLLKAPLPLSLKAFYEVVGAVDFTAVLPNDGSALFLNQ